MQAFGVARIGLFGSAVRGESTAKSDIDLLVEFLPGKKTYKNFFASSEYLEKVFDRPVDLVTPQALSPYMKSRIDSEISYVQIS